MTKENKKWPAFPPVIAGIISLLFAVFLFTPCRCWRGFWDVMAGEAWLYVTIGVYIRYYIGRRLKEKKEGWIFYTILILILPILTSQIWHIIGNAYVDNVLVH